ncbi:peptide-binding protein [Oceanobacillus neutriphilus]|uniref:Peptide-binding protein n=1 Tax=Oceanobacillus neutriphilus TaxID=531815 RepID=A0ABQ2NNH3_9BACI|nr:peptide-binding protein [Oceanobacillus neutriphilus]GGP07830.1 peptide-binding protein [Oceanobacillus neutriphilus]
MKKGKKFWLNVFIFILTLFLVACNDGSFDSTASDASATDGEPAEGGDLIVGGLSGPTVFNSLYSTSSTDSTIQDFMFNGLVEMDENVEPQPDLAENWEQSEDGLAWTFNLRDDVTWHDGESFTADDVVFTYSLPIDEDYIGPRGSSFEKFEEVVKIDDYTVEIHLSDPAPDMLADAMGYHVLPEHILGDLPVEEVGTHEFNTKEPIGTGPYKFDEWKQGQYVRVVANEDYFEGRPYIDSITYKIVPDKNSLLAQFTAGDLDHLSLTTEDIPSGEGLVEDGAAIMESIESASYSFMLYNLEHPALKEKEVRHALAHGLDRNTVIDTVLDGNGNVLDIPAVPFMPAYNEDPPVFEYDPEKAKEILDEAGWEVGADGVREKNGERLSFSIISNQGNSVREKIMLIAKQQWEEELGAEVSTEIIESSAFSDQVHRHEFDIAMRGWSISLDPGISSAFATEQIENGTNYGFYSNPEVDRLREESDLEPDPEKRYELIEEAQAIIAEDQPYLFLYNSDAYTLYNPKLQGHIMHPKAEFYRVHEWWFAQD